MRLVLPIICAVLAGHGLTGIIVSGGPAVADSHLLAGADKDYGEYLSGECVTCHQLSGEYDGIPGIVGWDPHAFAEVMNEYRSKERENIAMRNIAGALSPEEIASLAIYFAEIQPAE